MRGTVDQMDAGDFAERPMLDRLQEGGASGALRLAEKQIEILRAEVVALTQGRSEWVAMLSHELRTPLAILSGYSRLLLSEEAGTLSEKQSHYLEESRKSCRRLESLLGKLLDVVDGRGLEGRLEVQSHDPAELIHSVLGMMGPILESRGIQVDLDLPDDLPICFLDRIRIEQVITNLLQNALGVTKSGGILRISARMLGDAPNHWLECSVQDHGPGIAAHQKERIFEPFFQVSASRAEFGLGLGLAISSAIVEAHRGRISVEDVPGGGSRFFFLLPPGGPGAGLSTKSVSCRNLFKEEVPR